MKLAAVSLSSLLLLMACEDKSTKTAPTAAPPRKGLYEGDSKLPHQPALAVGTEGESSWRVTIPTGIGGVDCEGLLGAYPERPRGAAYAIDFWLRQPLETDGQAGPWGIRSCFAYEKDGEGRGMTMRGGLVDDAAKTGERLRVQGLELAVQDQDRHFVYTGDLPVKICGRKKRAEPDRPQPELKLSIADLPIEVHGASLRPEAGKIYLRLTRAPHKCGSVFTEGYDFYLDLALDGAEGGDEEKPPEPKVAFAALQGDLFPGDPSGSQGKEAFKVEPSDAMTGTGAVDVRLDGKLELSGYPITMKGKVSALRCTPVDRSPVKGKAPAAAPSAGP